MKQVIVVRKDLNMRKGKMIAQGAHASLMAYRASRFAVTDRWIDDHAQAKICLGASSEDEIRRIHAEALAAGLVCEMVFDHGRTEFHGVETLTALCIGPDDSTKIDAITEKLSLL